MPNAPAKRRRLRFSLRSLVLFVLLLASAGGLWWRWEPWVTAIVFPGRSLLMCCAFSTSGDRVILGGTYEEARVFDRATGDVLFDLTGHTKGLNFVAFSPDDRFIVTASDDHDARLWDGQTGRPLHVLKGHQDVVNTARFSPDGRTVLTASDDGTAILWSCRTAERLMRFKAGFDARFSPEGRMVLTASDGAGNAQVWDAATGELLVALESEALPYTEDVFRFTGAMCCGCFSPDGMFVATGDSSLKVTVWEIRTARKHLVWKGHDSYETTGFRGKIEHVHFTRDGKRLLIEDGDGTSRILDVESGREEVVFRGVDAVNDPVSDPRLSPDESRVASRGVDGQLSIWDRSSGLRLAVSTEHQGNIIDQCFSPDGMCVLSASVDGTARLYARRRPEYWWGLFWLWETWAAMVFGIGLIYSLYRDRRRFRERQGELA